MERNTCDNFTFRFRDEESDGAYSDLDLETNGSDPDYKPLPSEEMHSFGQGIGIDQMLYDCLRPSCMCLSVDEGL